MKYTLSNTVLNTWFERDRAHVELCLKETEETILDFWDDEFHELIRDGFLHHRNLHKSMVDYANYRMPIVIGA